jgi:hypothetical protein
VRVARLGADCLSLGDGSPSMNGISSMPPRSSLDSYYVIFVIVVFPIEDMEEIMGTKFGHPRTSPGRVRMVFATTFAFTTTAYSTRAMRLPGVLFTHEWNERFHRPSDSRYHLDCSHGTQASVCVVHGRPHECRVSEVYALIIAFCGYGLPLIQRLPFSLSR